MMKKTIDWSDYFEEVAGGEIRLKGSRIAIDTIIERYRCGSTPEEMALDYNSISLAQVYATITYYLSNRVQIDAYLEEGYRIMDEFIREQNRNLPTIPLHKMNGKGEYARMGAVV